MVFAHCAAYDMQDEQNVPVHFMDANGRSLEPGLEGPPVSELVKGNIIKLRQGDKKKPYEVVSLREENQELEVQLKPVRIQLHKNLLLLAVLAVTWFAIQYLFETFIH